MKLRAPAKINLWLSVGKRRADGYHEIASIMQAVSHFDELEMNTADATTFDVEPPGAAPEDESNLVVRALRTFSASTDAGDAVAITLRKNIPSAAGLAGGSADAAATLVGLNELWKTGMSKKAIEKIGASIGADVPFCVRGGTALARGIGEDLSPLACPKPLWWVIASGGESLSSAAVYGEFDRDATQLEDPFDLADAVARGDLESIATGLRNDLYVAALRLLPSLERTGVVLREAGALAAIMSGSGPAWCALARDEEHANQIAAASSKSISWVTVARSVTHGPRPENL